MGIVQEIEAEVLESERGNLEINTFDRKPLEGPECGMDPWGNLLTVRQKGTLHNLTRQNGIYSTLTKQGNPFTT